jgi:mRNA-degrading endonuclease toxin of MazEF toxin-antitoxin module
VTDSGDIYLADLGGEQRELVMVLSHQRFTDRSGRVLVAPGWVGPHLVVPRAWHVPVDDQTFAIDYVLTINERDLLDHRGRAPYTAVMAARRALIAIT